MLNPDGTILALDIGERRIGVASARVSAGLPTPLTTVDHTETVTHALQNLFAQHEAVALVMGLPRGLDGQETAQTRRVETFVAELKKHTDLPIYWQDEAVTSRKAEEELQRRGKPYAKGDIDALAATYILEDFLQEHPEEVRS